MAFVLLCAAVQMQGKIKLPAIISDNMVVQQKSQVKLWGWADAGQGQQAEGGSLEVKTEGEELVI